MNPSQLDSLLTMMTTEKARGCNSFRATFPQTMTTDDTLDLVAALTAKGCADVTISLPVSGLPGDYLQIAWRAS